MRTHLSFLVAVGLLAAPAFAAVKWRGDFETGDLSQYGSKQMVSADRIQIVNSPVFQGSKAIKVTVIQGDDPINASGNRNELVRSVQDPEGSEVYYRWQTMFAADFPSPNTWQCFAQWHQPEDYGYPPIQFQSGEEKITLTLGQDERILWSTPLVRSKWHDFVLHVKFSDDASKGFVELWYDGQHVVPRTFGQTRANAWAKLGLYRNEIIAKTGVVFHDGWIMGDTYADVMNDYPTPGAPVATPTPTPPVTTTPPATTPPVRTVTNVDAAPVVAEPIDVMPQAPPPSDDPVGTVEYPLDDPNSEASAEGRAGCNVAGGGIGAIGLLGLLAMTRRRRARAAEAKRPHQLS